MKLHNSLAASLLAASASARWDLLSFDAQQPISGPEQFLIETAPGVTQWVVEDEKWALRRDGIRFMDITEFQDLGIGLHAERSSKVTFPSKIAHNETHAPLLKKLSAKNMRENLEKFSSFYTRYYKSKYGVESSAWLEQKVNATIGNSSAASHASVTAFPHEWSQSSLIATIPGKSNKTIVIGAHQDSINLFFPSVLPAPGADDDGSGTVTILEALRVLLEDPVIANGSAPNTLEFHWYSAEESGLLGSQDIFSSYSNAGRDVKAMLQQDMTGYLQATLDAGQKEHVGVVTDFVDPDLTEYIKKVIDAYCDVPWVETKCGYACSDHASANKAGYPSAFVIESEFGHSDKRIHTTEDLVRYLSFEHMVQHAKLTLGLALELAMADFD